jgi:hypothetical protein
MFREQSVAEKTNQSSLHFSELLPSRHLVHVLRWFQVLCLAAKQLMPSLICISTGLQQLLWD